MHSPLGRLLRYPLRWIPKNAAVPILQGPACGMKWIVGSANHGCWLGSYEWEKQKVFARSVRPGFTVFDIGANAGFYTLLAARLAGQGGRVYAFEPLPRNLHYLHTHVECNGLLNVSILPIAVGAKESGVRFDDSGSPSMAHLSEDGALEVQMRSLDSLRREQLIRPPNVVKIDVEGAEFGVLLGGENLLSAARPLLFLATHGAEVRSRCLEWLRRHAYGVSALGDRAFKDADEFVATPSDWVG